MRLALGLLGLLVPLLLALTCAPPEEGLIRNPCSSEGCAPMALAVEMQVSGATVEWFAHYGGELLVLEPGECIRIENRETAWRYIGHAIVDGQPANCAEQPAMCQRTDTTSLPSDPCDWIWEPD
jgi:hypothetical protein